MRRWLVLLVLLVAGLVPAPAVAWEQVGGGPGHDGLADLPAELVVTWADNVNEDGYTSQWGMGLGIVRSEGQLALFASGPPGSIGGVDNRNNLCRLVHVADSAPAAIDLPDCDGSGYNGNFVAVDEATATGFVCRDSAGPTRSSLHAVDLASAAVRWGNDQASYPATETTGEVTTTVFSCGLPAYDAEAGILYTPFGGHPIADTSENRGGDHLIAAIDASDGAAIWTTRVTSVQLAGSQVPYIDPSGGNQAPRIFPLTATLTESGLVVVADINNGRAAMTLTPQGDLTGVHFAGPFLGDADLGRIDGGPTDDLQRDTAGDVQSHGWAVADGPLAYLALNEEVLVLDPTLSEPLLRRPIATARPFVPQHDLGPAVSGTVLLLPAVDGVTALDRSSLDVAWQYTAPRPGGGTALHGMIPASDGTVWLLEDHNRDGLRVVRLDAETGNVLVALGLPYVGTSLGVGDLHLSALEGQGLAVMVEPDMLMLLEAPPAADFASIDTAYPDVGEPVRVTAAQQRSNLTVHWGDGTSSLLATGSVTHTYRDAGRHTVRVVESPDVDSPGLQTFTVNVGTQPPVESFLQKAFAPERQDMTWGIIGLFLAVLSGIGAVAVRAWRTRGIARDLDRLDRLRAMAVDDGLAALSGLRSYRIELRFRAARGKIDGAQYATLASEADKLAGALQTRLLHGMEGRLSSGLRRLLDAAIADGVLSEAERAALRKSLKGEIGLTTKERNAMAALLDDWQ